MYPMRRVEAASVAKMAFKNVPSQKLVVGGASGSHMPTMKEEMYLTTATPWKINMEPTNHPFRKENDLPNLHDYGPC